MSSLGQDPGQRYVRFDPLSAAISSICCTSSRFCCRFSLKARMAAGPIVPFNRSSILRILPVRNPRPRGLWGTGQSNSRQMGKISASGSRLRGNTRSEARKWDRRLEHGEWLPGFRETQVTDFPLLNQLCGSYCFFYRSIGINPVLVVQVNHLNPKRLRLASQAGIHSLVCRSPRNCRHCTHIAKRLPE